LLRQCAQPKPHSPLPSGAEKARSPERRRRFFAWRKGHCALPHCRIRRAIENNTTPSGATTPAIMRSVMDLPARMLPAIQPARAGAEATCKVKFRAPFRLASQAPRKTRPRSSCVGSRVPTGTGAGRVGFRRCAGFRCALCLFNSRMMASDSKIIKITQRSAPRISPSSAAEKIAIAWSACARVYCRRALRWPEFTHGARKSQNSSSYDARRSQRQQDFTKDRHSEAPSVRAASR